MLSRLEVNRYSRQLMLPQWGAEAQQRLKEARVLVVGAGGLGTPVLSYLVAAGVGHIYLAEDDVIELSNLQRQGLYNSFDVGRSKAEVAIARLQQLNPLVHIQAIGRPNAQEAAHWIEQCHLTIDCADNFATRYLINDICTELQRPWVWGAAQGFEGMCSVWDHRLNLRHMFPEPPSERQDCDTLGVFGAMLGVVASTMAVEALKYLADVGESLYGRLWVYQALDAKTRTITLKPQAKLEPR